MCLGLSSPFFFFFPLLAGTPRLSKKQRGDLILFWSQLFRSPQWDRICDFLCSPGPAFPGPLPHGAVPGDSTPLSFSRGPTVSCPAHCHTQWAPSPTRIPGPASSVAASSEIPRRLGWELVGFGLRAWGLCRPQQSLANRVAQNSRNPFLLSQSWGPGVSNQGVIRALLPRDSGWKPSLLLLVAARK